MEDDVKNLKNNLKSMIVKNGWTQAEFVDILNDKQNRTKLSPSDISRKLNNGKFSYFEVADILDTLGYKIEFVKKEDN